MVDAHRIGPALQIDRLFLAVSYQDLELSGGFTVGLQLTGTLGSEGEGKVRLRRRLHDLAAIDLHCSAINLSRQNSAAIYSEIDLDWNPAGLGKVGNKPDLGIAAYLAVITRQHRVVGEAEAEEIRDRNLCRLDKGEHDALDNPDPGPIF